jgi:hypothetical protein
MTRDSAMRRYSGWFLLIAAALMMRALVPQGWMPDTGSHSLFAIKPCAPELMLPDAPMQMSSSHHDHMDMSGAGQHSDHSEHFAGEPCAFSGFGMAGLAGEDFAILSDPLPVTQEFGRVQSDAIAVARRRTLPPARAPPLSV